LRVGVKTLHNTISLFAIEHFQVAEAECSW